MELANRHEAKSRLPKLVDKAVEGEEVVITRAGQPVVRLVAIHHDSSPRVGGQWEGRVKIAAEFDSLPDDIADGFGMETSAVVASIRVL